MTKLVFIGTPRCVNPSSGKPEPPQLRWTRRDVRCAMRTGCIATLIVATSLTGCVAPIATPVVNAAQLESGETHVGAYVRPTPYTRSGHALGLHAFEGGGWVTGISAGGGRGVYDLGYRFGYADGLGGYAWQRKKQTFLVAATAGAGASWAEAEAVNTAAPPPMNDARRPIETISLQGRFGRVMFQPTYLLGDKWWRVAAGLRLGTALYRLRRFAGQDIRELHTAFAGDVFVSVRVGHPKLSLEFQTVVSFVDAPWCSRCPYQRPVYNEIDGDSFGESGELVNMALGLVSTF